MSDVKCPYCGIEEDINHDDGYGYDEDMVHHQECSECGSTFTFQTSITFSYEVGTSDCLNGGPNHVYTKHRGYRDGKNIEYSLCEHCGDTTPTIEVIDDK